MKLCSMILTNFYFPHGIEYKQTDYHLWYNNDYQESNRDMKAETVNVLLMILPLGIALVVLTAAVLIDRFINKEQKRMLLIIVAVLSTLIAQNYHEWVLPKNLAMLATLTFFFVFLLQSSKLSSFFAISSSPTAWRSWSSVYR